MKYEGVGTSQYVIFSNCIWYSSKSMNNPWATLDDNNKLVGYTTFFNTGTNLLSYTNEVFMLEFLEH